MSQDPSLEALLREVLATGASLSAKLEGLDRRVDGVQSDAREARDAARDSLAQTRAQDLPTKVAELRGHVDSGFQAHRADLVNAVDKFTREMRDKFAAQDKRLDDLEAFRDKLNGASGLLGWLAKHAPWLISILLAGVAAAGLKEKL